MDTVEVTLQNTLAQVDVLEFASGQEFLALAYETFGELMNAVSDDGGLRAEWWTYSVAQDACEDLAYIGANEGWSIERLERLIAESKFAYVQELAIPEQQVYRFFLDNIFKVWINRIMGGENS